jgi:hypothetical protein
MSDRLPILNRLRLYLYSPRNIAGCCLGMLGLGLLFGGVIDLGWPLIVAGLYLVGALAWPRNTLADTAEAAELTPERLVEQLDDLVKRVAKGLPEAALQHLGSIQTTLAELSPRLRTLEQSGALSIESAFTVEETLRRYLPEMLAGYLRLPPAFARLQPLKDGRTAAQTLTDQLGMLDDSLKQIAQEAFAGDAEALINSGRFLRRTLKVRPAYELS